MDPDRFDDVSRGLSRHPSRRGVLGGLSTALFAALPLALGGEDAAARKKKKKNKKKCKRGTKTCGKACIPSTNCCTAADCDDGGTCQNGSCSTSCTPRCDGRTCGADGCGGSCGSCGNNEVCDGGTCVCIPNCAAVNACGADGCGGTCGSCGNNEVCDSGTCVCVPECAPTNACGADGCGGSCGTCAPNPTCQGTQTTRNECLGGTCTPVTTNCGAGQVCFQNACCTRSVPPTCRKQAIPDGCGGAHPANCTGFCCEGPGGGALICQATPCL